MNFDSCNQYALGQWFQLPDTSGKRCLLASFHVLPAGFGREKTPDNGSSVPGGTSSYREVRKPEKCHLLNCLRR